MQLFGNVVEFLNRRRKSYLVAQLNARLLPEHRGVFFEDPLEKALAQTGLGTISGGGTLQERTGEIAYCDIEIEISGRISAAVDCVVSNLERLGAPKGSKLHVEAESREVPFGRSEGLAIYLNGTDLPDSVYRECDSNFVHSEFDRLLDHSGQVLSYWQGPRETAFYVYGSSYQGMNERLASFITSYPLCEKCRIVQIA